MARRAAAGTPSLDIRLLGPPEVLVDGRPLQVDTRKAIAILAVLATDARPYARDELAALLWPESDDDGARGALRRTLSTLRSAVGDGPLVIDRTRVDLDRSAIRVDLATMESAATGPIEPSALTAAAGLARGAFLAGFSLRDSPEFDDWRAARSVAAERAVLAVLDRLAAVAEADGDLPTAIGAVERRLAVDPLDEAAHVRLMELLAASGDRSGALRQYRACVATLDRELGVAPLATTTSRYEAIRDATASPVDASRATAADVAVAPATRAASPRPLPLVGRDDAMRALLDAHAEVGRDGGRIVAVVGEAGIGKTRVVDEATARMTAVGSTVLAATAYPTERSIAYGTVVDLLRAALDRPDGRDRAAALDAGTRAELARLLPAMDPTRAPDRAADGPGAHARLVAAITAGLSGLVAGPAPGVIRIDDIGWLDPATREALDALVNRPERHRVLVVVAWRPEDLDVEGGAFVERLRDRSHARTVVLERLGREEVAALVEAAGSEAGVDRLVAASEGLPLYVSAVLTAEPDTDVAAGALPGSVRAILRHRLASVGDATAQVVAAGSVIGRSFDVATVRQVSGRSEDEVVEAMEQAGRRGIVRDVPTGFDFTHGALRDLAYEATSLARRRLLHRRAAEAFRLDVARSGRDDLGRLALVAFHERAAGRDAEAAEAHVAAGERAAAVYANREAIDHLEAALALGHKDAIELSATIGRLLTRLGDYDRAIEALEVAAAAASGDQAALATLESSLARAHLRRGDLAAAAHHLDAAAAAATTDELRVVVAVDRSVLCRRLGDAAGAEDAAVEARRLAAGIDDPAAIGAAHRMLGLTALDAGDVGRAVAELRLAVEAAAADPDPTARIAALVALALATAASGSVDDAVAHGEAAVATCRRIGDRHLEAAVENHLADLLHDAGRDAEARPHQLRAIEAFAEVGGDPADPDPGIWMLSVS